MGEPGFWDDQERAAKVAAEHARSTRKLSTFRQLESDVADLEPLAEIAEEDPDIADELEEQVSAVQDRLDALEEGRRRHRRTGLGGDGAADGDAVGREARL